MGKAGAGVRFSVMSFNIRGSRFADGANVWPQRRTLNVATILKYAPDIIGFQEVQRGNLVAYAGHLTAYDCQLGRAGVLRGEAEERVAIYWKRDRFERVDGGSFFLSETPDRWSRGWGANLTRVANWVRLRCRLTGHATLTLNTHLDHESHLARLEGSRLIVRRLDALARDDDGAIVVTGDFNDPAVAQPSLEQPAGRAHTIFTAAGFRDTFIEAGYADGPEVHTFHKFEGPARAPYGLRIDWVLVRDGAQQVRTRALSIVQDAAPPLYPSDHYPVLAALELAPRVAG